MSLLDHIAIEIARANPEAGSTRGGPNDRATRAHRLVAKGYVVLGDPAGWASDDARPLATMFTEPKGGPGDCAPPARYYSDNPFWEFEATDMWWEWQNAAVAFVWAG